MLNPHRYAHAATSVELLETHISWVLLAGEYAYKIKKPVNFGFLDYSTLARRKRFCQAEVELNQRYAPNLYIDVVAIGGPAEAPRLGATSNILDYAVRMHRFGDHAVLADRDDLAQLDAKLLDTFASSLATIHANAPRRPDFGGAELAMRPVRDSLDELRQHAPATAHASIENVTAAMEREYSTLQPLLQSRASHIRECHGDLHLGNLALMNDEVLAFDGIEFNDALRCIDPVSDLAFLLMDLHERGWPEQANRVLTIYMENSGDYAGLAALRFYRAYRALVRAKVAALQWHADTGRSELATNCCRYLNEALISLQPTPPFLLIVRGVSGSGKSYMALKLAARFGALRLRSDRERKRLASGDHADLRLYGQRMSNLTYRKLNRLAVEVIEAGYPVVLDATFLDATRIRTVIETAKQRNIPLASIDCHAPLEVMRQRLAARARLGDDPSDADRNILDAQLAMEQPDVTGILNELQLDTSKAGALDRAACWVQNKLISN
jgi:aminoglycoside phosphotransferase family enzyme/predicted kinase